MTARMPVTFVAHGAPPLLDDAGWLRQLAAWGEALPKPKAILVISAHWEARPATLGATSTIPLVYDFYGFPQRYYQLRYPSPGAPALAERVRELLRGRGLAVADDPTRGLDHGAYIPLVPMYPKADVPVLQLSLPTLEPRALLNLGRALAPLRDEGVLIMGSGFLTHNMRAMMDTTPQWAKDFDGWVADTLTRGDLDGLADFERKAPAAAMANPRTEHFVPVLVAAGAAEADLGAVTFPITGFWLGSFTKRSVQWG